MHGESAYGLWFLVFLNSAIFIIFAFSFTKPKNKWDWRSFGGFSAFIIAMFTEMYGVPLTIYFMSGWLSEKFPALDIFSHESGHIWSVLLGSEIDPHFHPIHLAANVFIIIGFFMLSAAWKVLLQAQKEGRVATTGLYTKMRHPQYVGFVLIMFGFLLMWPTLLTLVMFPILLYMYYRLGKGEEQDSIKDFGQEYVDYMKRTPAFIPNWDSLFSKEREV